MDDLIISMAVAILLASIKNPAKKEKLRKVCVKIFNSIRAAFPGDPDFQC